jgi:mannose-6-phosphate isomerase-like protein (cupin superfamily)
MPKEDTHTMPVFRSGKGLAPKWCELEYFEIIELAPGTTHRFERLGRKEKLVVCKGKCRLSVAGEIVEAQEGTNIDLTRPEGEFGVVEVLSPATVLRLCGRWGDETGGSGLFTAMNSDNPTDRGDPVPYPKMTNFDSHYHDCDEYWIILEGRGVAVSEGQRYEIGPGDCLATGMGHHHDLVEVLETIRGFFFETTLEGQKRRGHLWEHTHGPAKPREDRV